MFRHLCIVVAAVIVATTWFGCSSNQSSEPPPVPAIAYPVVLDEFLPTGPSDKEQPIIRIVPINDPFSVDEQVEILNAVPPEIKVSFIDAVGDISPAELADTMLIAVGRISPEPPHVVRVEVLEEGVHRQAFRVEVTDIGTPDEPAWALEQTETIESEFFPAAS